MPNPKSELLLCKNRQNASNSPFVHRELERSIYLVNKQNRPFLRTPIRDLYPCMTPKASKKKLKPLPGTPSLRKTIRIPTHLERHNIVPWMVRNRDHEK